MKRFTIRVNETFWISKDVSIPPCIVDLFLPVGIRVLVVRIGQGMECLSLLPLWRQGIYEVPSVEDSVEIVIIR